MEHLEHHRHGDAPFRPLCLKCVHAAIVCLAHSMDAVCFALKLGHPKSVELLDVGDISQDRFPRRSGGGDGATPVGSWPGG